MLDITMYTIKINVNSDRNLLI